MNTENITFSIDALTPETLSLERLAEYLKELAALYGSKDFVHFRQVAPGSALLEAFVEPDGVPKVADQLERLRKGSANKEAVKAFKNLNNLLRDDNAIGKIYGLDRSNILEFPGREIEAPHIVRISQQTTVDGVVIKIGGVDETIPVTLRDQEGNLIRCEVRGSALAKEIGRHYLEDPIRVHGIGKWQRDENGWSLEQLNIQAWSALDTRSASDVLFEMARAGDNQWKLIDDSMGEWRKMRGLD